MAKTLDDYMKKLPKGRRDAINKRAKELIAEEMSLQELRLVRKLSQQELAKQLGVKQAEISKIEHRADVYVSTLRSYIEGMGGSLEIIAKFPKHKAVKIARFAQGS